MAPSDSSDSLREKKGQFDQARRALQDLGLTDNEIKAYLVLLESPASQASDISRSAEVPISKIYEVLSNLERKGWVELQQASRPAKYYPKSPATAIQALRIRRELELKQNEELLVRELLPRFQRKVSQERPDIWIIRGEYNILAKLQESIDRCDKEILVVFPAALNEVIELMIPALTAIQLNGVSSRIMVSELVERKSLEKIAAIASLRIKDNMFGGGVIIDAKEVILLLGGGEKSDQKPGESALAIWSDHIGLASFAKNYFEFLWSEAVPFKEMIDLDSSPKKHVILEK